MSNGSNWKFIGCSIRLDDTDVARVYQHYGLSEAEFKRRGKLLAAAPELLEALIEGRRAIGDHHAPNDCYATGPMTGNHYRDLVECPACSFIAMYDTAIAKAAGE